MRGNDYAGNIPAVAREILQYLAEHPDARDTVEGILKWWLPTGPVQRRKKEVQQALDLLVAEGWLEVREIGQSSKIYGLNQARLDDLRVFTDERQGKPEEDDT